MHSRNEDVPPRVTLRVWQYTVLQPIAQVEIRLGVDRRGARQGKSTGVSFAVGVRLTLSATGDWWGTQARSGVLHSDTGRA